jgi:hypothetical protein
MAEESDDLSSAVTELDDAYLKVLMLLAVRETRREEPRRAGFWHSLAGLLATEQEKRRDVAEFRRDAAPAAGADDIAELTTVVAELRRDLEALEAEYRESYGQLDDSSGRPPQGPEPAIS